MGTTASDASRAGWQRRVFITSWITYASFYLGRVNLAVTLPALQDQFGWAKAQAGLIGSAFFWAYAVGQLVNGAFGDRLNARTFITAGLIMSALVNLTFGLAGNLALMALLWAINGYVQSFGWGPMMGLLSRWFDPRQRGRVSALFGPCYVAGHVTSWLLAGRLIAMGNWRVAFWVPAGLLAISATHWWLRVRNDPVDAGLENRVGRRRDRVSLGELWRGLRDTFGFLFSHPQLRTIGVACIGMGVIKEGFSFWIPTLLTESMGLAITEATGYAIALPIAGALGILISGWISVRFFGSNELPVMSLLMGILALTMALYLPAVRAAGQWIIPLLLGLIGASVHGANTLVVTSFPLRYTSEGRVSSIAGLFEFTSYVGAVIGGFLAGALVDLGGWGAAFALWVVAALLGMAIMVSAWIRERQAARQQGR